MNNDLNRILTDYQVTTFKQARPEGKTQQVRDLYEIKINNSSLLRNMYEELKGLNQIDNLLLVCEVPATGRNSIDINGFNDPLVQGNNAWYLSGMNIPCAWGITQGSPSQTVAVVDIYFDYTHQDLQNKIVSITNVSNFNNPVCNHGFASAGAVAAIVNNGICTVGSGYNTNVACYIVGSGCESDGSKGTGNPRSGILRAIADGHKIISVSFDITQMTQSEIDEYIADGSTLIQSAFGNSQPLSATDGYIYVAQADANFNHRDDGYGTQAGADIYALCVGVPRLQSQNGCANGPGNTSFGAPTVAGIVALMKSANPCLSPQDIDKLLKQTQGPLPGNAPAGNTAGIMDACAAVQAAQNGLDYIVRQNTTIDGTKSVSGDLIIENGAVLTVTGTLKLAKKLIVRKGTHLNINGGTLTRNCGDWIGVIVEGNGANQSSAGKVTMTNGAIIEGAVTGISMNPAHIPWPALASSWGGLVTASNSTIRDCRRAVEFMQMDYDESSFIGCSFSNIVNNGITLWDVDGVQFNGCVFTNIGKSAILAYDSRISVSGSNITSTKNGIEVVATIPATDASQLLGNVFSDNQHGIYALTQTGAKHLNIGSNHFYGGENAITIAGISEYNIYSNSALGSEFGVKLYATGSSEIAFVENNQFSSLNFGSLANFQNSTEYINNCFYYNSRDLEVNSGSIGSSQGIPGVAARNCFGNSLANPNVLRPNIWLYNNTSFNYYYNERTPIDCQKPNKRGNGTFKDIAITSSDVHECSTVSPPPILHRTCSVPSNAEQATQMIKDLEAEIARLLANTELDQNLKAYLIKRYKACITKIKKNKVVIIGKQLEGNTKEQAARDAAAYAKSQEELSVKMMGFTMLTDAAMYVDAQQYLNTFGDNGEEGTDFVAIQNINLQYMINRGNFILSNGTKEAIRSLGDKTTPISGFARSLYYKLTGEKIPLNFIYSDDETEIRAKKDVLEDELVRIYPNPASDLLHIDIKLEVDTKFTYDIMDTQGRIMKSGSLLGASQSILDISSLPKGMYFINILNEEQSISVQKIVKE